MLSGRGGRLLSQLFVLIHAATRDAFHNATVRLVSFGVKAFADQGRLGDTSQLDFLPGTLRWSSGGGRHL